MFFVLKSARFRRLAGSWWVHFLCLVALTAPATAQEPLPGFGAPAGKSRLPGFGADALLESQVIEEDRVNARSIFQQVDRNRDGNLQTEELVRGGWNANTIKQFDTNGDGQFLLPELERQLAAQRLKRLRERRRQQAQAAKTPSKTTPPPFPQRTSAIDRQRRQTCQQLAQDLIARYDSNGNKQLEMTEWQAAASNEHRDIQRADTNNDRTLMHDEITAWLLQRLPPTASSRLAKPLRLRDHDGDGQIGMHEYTTSWTPELLAQFQSLDRNDDGIISPRESHLAPVPRAARRYETDDIRVLYQGNPANSEIEIPDALTIADLDIEIAMTKQQDQATDITLIAPDGTSVKLFSGEWFPWNGASIFEGTLIDDEAAVIKETLPHPPFPRRLTSDARRAGEKGLAQFYGTSARGTWRMVIMNRGKIVGILHRWSLFVTPAKPSASSQPIGPKPE